MNARTIFIILMVAVVAGGLLYFFVFKNKSAPPTAATNELPGANASGSNIPTTVNFDTASDFLTIATPRGEIKVKNFYKNIISTEEGFVIIEDNDTDQIAYLPDNKTFYIYVRRQPFEESRKLSENDFLKVLGIVPLDACSLDVVTFGPKDPRRPGLTFCND